jgi:hypothetical protein
VEAEELMPPFTGPPMDRCKLHGVNPDNYLADVLTRLVNLWQNSRAHPLGWESAITAN